MKCIAVDKSMEASTRKKKEEVRALYPNVSATSFTHPFKVGNLTKEGGEHKTWKTRYFVLDELKLFYFRTAKDSYPTGVIELEGCEIFKDLTRRKDHCFQISHPSRRTFFICAKSEEEMKSWVQAMQRVVKEKKFTGKVNRPSAFEEKREGSGESLVFDFEEAKKAEKKWRPISVILMEGPLMKLSSSRSGEWRERWFELRKNVLLFYKEVGDAQACGVVPLHECQVSACASVVINSPTTGGGGSSISSSSSGGEESGVGSSNSNNSSNSNSSSSSVMYSGISDDKLKKSFRVYHPQRRTFFLMAKNERKMKRWVSQIHAAMTNDDGGEEGSGIGEGGGGGGGSGGSYSNGGGGGSLRGSSFAESLLQQQQYQQHLQLLSQKKRKRINRRVPFVKTMEGVTIEGFLRCKCFPPPPPSAEFQARFKMDTEKHIVFPRPSTRKSTRKSKNSLAVNRGLDVFGGYDLGDSGGKRQTWYFILKGNVLYILQEKMDYEPLVAMDVSEYFIHHYEETHKRRKMFELYHPHHTCYSFYSRDSTAVALWVEGISDYAMEDIDGRFPVRSDASDDEKEKDDGILLEKERRPAQQPATFVTFTTPRNSARRNPSIGRSKAVAGSLESTLTPTTLSPRSPSVAPRTPPPVPQREGRGLATSASAEGNLQRALQSGLV